VTHRQTDKQTNKNRRKHNLLGGGKYDDKTNCGISLASAW